MWHKVFYLNEIRLLLYKYSKSYFFGFEKLVQISIIIEWKIKLNNKHNLENTFLLIQALKYIIKDYCKLIKSYY